LTKIERRAYLIPVPKPLRQTLQFDAAKEAGYQRKPAVNYFTAVAFERNPDLRMWPPVTRGVEEAVYEDPSALADAIVRLLTPEGFAPMRARQEAVYLKPDYQGAAVDKIVAAIREIAGV
jgi:hypothetical protein